MKKLSLPLLILLFSIFIINSCTEKIESEEKNIISELISRSDCKHNFDKVEVTDSMSCIEYEYNNNLLIIQHINAGFNCCPGNITCENTVKNDTIIITEKEESPLCNCNCLFDLKIQVSGLENKKYFLKIVEPYVEDQEKFFFEIDLSKSDSGIHCVERLKYPWGM